VASLLGTQSSESQSSGSSRQRIMPYQKKALTDIAKQSKTLFNQQNANAQAMAPQLQAQMADALAKQTQSYNQLSLGGAYSGADLNSIMNKVEAFQNTPSQSTGLYENIMGGKGNNYVDAMKNMFVKDAQRTRDLSEASLDSRLAGTGMSGGSRHGVAQALVSRDIDKNLQDQMTKVGYDSFDKDLQNKLGIARLADEQMTARQGMYANLAGGALQGKDANMNQAASMIPGLQKSIMSQLAPSQVPWKNLQNYNAAIGNPTILTDAVQSGSSYSGK
jgi:hypothetical protein